MRAPGLACWRGALTLCVLVLLTTAAQAGKCADARATLRGFVGNLPGLAYLCDKTEDCRPYFLYAEACAPPVILGIAGDRYVGNMAPGLIPLQAKVRAVCPEPDYACSPIIPAFACVKNVCRVQKSAE